MIASKKKSVLLRNLVIGALGLQIAGLFAWIALDTTDMSGSFQVSHECPVEEANLATPLPDVCRKKAPNLTSIQLTSDLDALFKEKTYALDTVKAGTTSVPRVYLAKLPRDMNKKRMGPPRRQQHLFVKSLLPMILQVNEDVRLKRETLLDIKTRLAKGEKISREERLWLSELAAQYKVKPNDMKKLVSRVDEIPPSLALAQAAIETGWGSSYAAMAKNSPFGHMAGKKVKRFDNLYASVEAYIHNLNTNNAYKDLHLTRDTLRKKNENPSGTHLADGLKKYSVRGQGYIQQVKSTIKYHSLHEFDKAQLSNS